MNNRALAAASRGGAVAPRCPDREKAIRRALLKHSQLPFDVRTC
jgi:hypothetical protein